MTAKQVVSDKGSAAEDKGSAAEPEPDLAVIRLAARSDQVAQVRAGTDSRNDFRLTATSGELVALASYRGQPLMLMFGSSQCEQVCGQVSRRLSAAFERTALSPADYPIVLISTQGDQDTPDRLHRFVEDHGLLMTGLTGAPADVARLARRFDSEPGPEPQMIHWLDGNGIWRRSVSAAATSAQFADMLTSASEAGGPLASADRN